MEHEDKNEHIHRLTELENHLGKMLSDNLKIPVYTIDSKAIDDLYSLVINELPEMNLHFTDDELRMEVADFITKISIVKPPKNVQELSDKITQFIDGLKSEKEYEAIILFNGLINLPIGLKIGSIEIIEKTESPDKLMEHLNYLEDKKIINLMNCSWARVNFKSHKNREVREVLYKAIEVPCSILSFIMHMDFDVKDIAGIITAPNGTIHFLSSEFKPGGWSKFQANIYGKYLDLLSSISQKSKPTKLENRITQSIQIFWLSRLSQRTELLLKAYYSPRMTETIWDLN